MSSEVAITLPGDIPGLLRRGAPLLVDDGGVECTCYKIVEAVDGTTCFFSFRDGAVERERVADKRLNLNLSEPVGRDIAVRWMAEKLGMKVGLTAPVFDYIDGAVTGGPSGWSLEGHADSSGFFRAFISTPAAKPLKCDVVVPGLPLDPDQGIEALRLCVLHLAGRL